MQRRLQSRLRAADLAESALLSLQAGAPLEGVEIRTISEQGRFRWVELAANVDGESARLIGLVPREAKP